MKVAPLNRLQYSRNLEIGINAFGLIFCPVEFLEIIQKRKKRNGAVPLGQRGHSSSRPREEPAHAAATSKAVLVRIASMLALPHTPQELDV